MHHHAPAPAAPPDIDPDLDDDTAPVAFTCNVCGAGVETVMAELERETPSCPTCGSSVRFRSIVHLLSTALYGRSVPLTEFPVDSSIIGVGLSDAAIYAGPLAGKVGYHNTYYHTEPYLDITDPGPEIECSLDFMISSDVFEHVPPPVSRAFEGAFRCLKPGGHLLLTVPFTNDDLTIEHFPDLHTYDVIDLEGEQVLVNRDRNGRLSARDGLVFHGGGGATLEMRVFGRGDLLRHLAAAGFEAIEVFDRSVPEFGIHHRKPWSLPVVARRPG